MTRDIFAPIPQAERHDRLLAYAEFLAARDGQADLQRRLLSRREESLLRMQRAQVRHAGPVDRELFLAQYRRFDRHRATPPELLLLLAYVKINASEAFGVEAMADKLPRHPGSLAGRIKLTVLLEEHYHTRILLSAAALFGLSIESPTAPPGVVRALIAALCHLPDELFQPLLLMSEIIGVMAMLRMVAATRRIFRGEVRDAMEERAMEVLIDEVGHVSYNRLLLHPVGLSAARALLPALAAAVAGTLPGTEAIGILPLPWSEVLTFELKGLPEEVRRQAFIA